MYKNIYLVIKPEYEELHSADEGEIKPSVLTPTPTLERGTASTVKI